MDYNKKMKVDVPRKKAVLMTDKKSIRNKKLISSSVHKRPKAK